MIRRLRQLVHQPDQFDWFSAYLDERGLQTRWRALAALFTVSLATVPILLLASPTGPDNPATIAVSLLAAFSAMVGGLVWVTRWPTRRQSTIFTLVTIGAIASTCLAQSSPYGALMGCTTFAIIGGFTAYFHTLALVTFGLGVAMTSAVIATCRLVIDTGDVALAASAFLIVVGLNLGVPFGIHSLAHSLRTDLRSSGHDSLTGLLTRRAFFHSAYELLMRAHGADGAYLIVIVIDLDDFKKLNDTHGHRVGDQALVQIGAALRESCRATAVIGRLGGEEFVVADTAQVADAAALAERLRLAIAATSAPITASIGTASTPLTDSTTSRNLDFIDALIHSADVAMYDAKRDGGNRVCHSGGPGPLSVQQT